MVQLPFRDANHKLTGDLRVRIGAFGRIILQVEERYQMVRGWPGGAPEVGATIHRWRDATLIDIQQLSPMRLQGRAE